jgi:hypothetical protein
MTGPARAQVTGRRPVGRAACKRRRRVDASSVAFSQHAPLRLRQNACAMRIVFPNIHSSFPRAKRKTLTDDVRPPHAADVPPDDRRRCAPHAFGGRGAVPGWPALRRRSSLATPDRKTFRRVERRDARKVTRIPFRSRRPMRTKLVFLRVPRDLQCLRRRWDGRVAERRAGAPRGSARESTPEWGRRKGGRDL